MPIRIGASYLKVVVFVIMTVLALLIFTVSVSAFNVSNGISTSNDIPVAQSVFNTGSMSLPSTVKGFIIYIPDEAHHPPTDNKTISKQNANYIPTNLIVPKGTAIAFVHGDPNHIHIEIVKDNSTGQIPWKTTPINHPGGSDIKVLSPGSYSISDQKYNSMKGSIKLTTTNNRLVI
jgi:hypothetical protein